MTLRTVVDRLVVWVRKVEDAGPDPDAAPRRCPNPDHTDTDLIATRRGTVLRHWCTECGADLITPRGRIYGEEGKRGGSVGPDIAAYTPGGLTAAVARCNALQTYGAGFAAPCAACLTYYGQGRPLADAPPPHETNGHTNGHTGEPGSPHGDEG